MDLDQNSGIVTTKSSFQIARY